MADITMPQLGETVTEGTITKWFKKVGDSVKLDEPLFEVSTDKVDTEVGATEAGVLIEIRVAEGDVVQVGGVIAVLGAAGAAPAAAPAVAPAAVEAAPAPLVVGPPPAPAAVAAPAPAPAPVAAAPAPAPVVAAPAPAPVAAPVVAPVAVTPTASTGPVSTDGDNRLLSPVVRRLVNEHGLDPSSIAGTGAGGRITREDVLDYLDKHPGSAPAPLTAAPVATPSAAPAPPAPAPAAPAPAAPAPAVAAPAVAPSAGARDEVIALSKIRRLTGDHMRHSLQTAAAAFSVVEVDFANVDSVRDKAKGEWKAAEGFSLTYLPFISRAIVDAIAEFPHMNASVGDNELVVHKYVDLGIAVDMDYQGLIVPVIRGADGKRLRSIARETFDLANRARSRKLSPDEISGGTFTITNNGSAGSVLTMAVINQPQVAIISTDAIRRKPVVVNLPGGGESIGIHSVGNLAMTWDHRAFDGAYAAGFLSKVKELLETRDWSQEL
jgi:pyruvate dehydrogenase E2 component (dihydrolipoamide acetyltransferase)